MRAVTSAEAGLDAHDDGGNTDKGIHGRHVKKWRLVRGGIKQNATDLGVDEHTEYAA